MYAFLRRQPARVKELEGTVLPLPRFKGARLKVVNLDPSLDYPRVGGGHAAPNQDLTHRPADADRLLELERNGWLSKQARQEELAQQPLRQTRQGSRGAILPLLDVG